ncbi:unnamed protein product [Cladocopium goreaui]|uniref:Uncharacterized protein n=1 Tax=Cladocopium goreaui TaxID=2562237 RepID=A0A9P1CMR6_9DINO|nr:unnamed protein product [Cladocopium goreaui]
MGDPLEKVYIFFGFKVRVKQVLDVSVLKKIDQNSLYFVPWPAGVSSFEDELSRIAEELPLSIRVTISDWYFISIEEGISLWQDFLLSLKRSHAKKIRRYCKKPHKFHYTVTLEKTQSLVPNELLACYDFLCQTMRHNGDTHFYTKDSFVSHLNSLEEILVARHCDGRILGFYSGAVIGHDHSPSFRSYGVYHNLFIEHVKCGLQGGDKMIDLGNAGDFFKHELGAKAFRLAFSLRGPGSLRGGLALTAWAAQSWIQVLRLQEWPVLLQIFVLGLVVLVLWTQIQRWLPFVRL